MRELKRELAQEGAQLGVARRAAAGQLRCAVEACLADLGMAGSRFDVRISWKPYAKVPSLSSPPMLLYASPLQKKMDTAAAAWLLPWSSLSLHAGFCMQLAT